MAERKCSRKKVEPKHGGAKEQAAPVEPVVEKVSKKSGSDK